MKTHAESGDSKRRIRSLAKGGRLPMSDDSTANRERVFEFIVEFKREHDGLAPSWRQIAEECNLAVSTVQYYLFQLEKMKRIRLNGRRGIEVIGGVWDFDDP
jgi:hypothetical protein